jgi:hypothetical protein
MMFVGLFKFNTIVKYKFKDFKYWFTILLQFLIVNIEGRNIRSSVIADINLLILGIITTAIDLQSKMLYFFFFIQTDGKLLLKRIK